MTILLILMILTGIAIPTVLLLMKLARDNQVKRIVATPFPEAWEAILTEEYPLYKKLPWPLQVDLQNKIQIFLETKHFEGCGGFEVTDKHKIVVAAQACTLLLNRNVRVFPRLTSILIYPNTFVSKGQSMNGNVVAEYDIPVAGQSSGWGGQVVLAWNHVLGGVHNDKDGHNVVFHEFAHQLDTENLAADGLPKLKKADQYSPWVTIVGKEFNQFLEKVSKNKKDVIDEYGATNAAEFFAVVTETFFEKPHQLNKKHPELFEQFKEYYEIDPRDWE